MLSPCVFSPLTQHDGSKTFFLNCPPPQMLTNSPAPVKGGVKGVTAANTNCTIFRADAPFARNEGGGLVGHVKKGCSFFFLKRHQYLDACE